MADYEQTYRDFRWEVPASYNFAVVALGLGERDRALGWLEKALDERSSQMCFLRVEPLWDSLRPDPRFREVLKQVGFTP